MRVNLPEFSDGREVCDLLVAANGKLSDSALGVNGSVVQSVVWRSIVLCAVCLIRSKG